MTTVGEDFPRQQERVRKLREEYLKLPNGAGAFGAEIMDKALARAAEAQASGDVVLIIQAYDELRRFE